MVLPITNGNVLLVNAIHVQNTKSQMKKLVQMLTHPTFAFTPTRKYRTAQSMDIWARV